MKGVSLLRRFAASRPSIVARSSSLETLLLSSAAATASYSTLILSNELRKPLFHFEIAPRISVDLLSGLPINHRNFSSESASGQSKMVLIETEKQLNDSLIKAQGTDIDFMTLCLPYFTSQLPGVDLVRILTKFFWNCVAHGKFISPIIGQLSEKYPHVTTYKIDIDQDDLASALTKLNISAVPTVYFFKDGKKASAVVGADANQLSATMEELYK